MPFPFEWEYRRQIILIQDAESLLSSFSSGWCGASHTIYTCRDLIFLGVSKWFAYATMRLRKTSPSSCFSPEQ
eukprot:scaffold96536_cov54-Attheya_sp.AAC.2